MKKFLMIMLLVSIVPIVVADCGDTCNTNSSNCNACCITDVSCCENAQAYCAPNGCCVEEDDDDCSCHCLVSAHTFMSIRPQFQGASPEKVSLWRYERMYAREDGKHGTFQVVPFGGRSTEARRMATYFMPFCKSTLVVAESTADTDVTRDIDPWAFGVFSVNGDFKSNISFRPRQSVAGVGLSWRQRLSRNVEPKGFWFEASMPIEHVRNSVNLCETVINDGGGVETTANVANAQPNMTTAFQQASFLFGRIPCDDCDGDSGLSKTGIADLDLRIGYGWKNEGICHLESYIGVLVPTGNKVKGCNLFEPIIGHNHHVGFEFGNAMGFRIWSNEEKEREIWMETSIHSIYLNNNWERRSFDVKYKPWSRYLPVFTSFAQAQAAAANPTTGNVGYTPGINVFTNDVKIQGRFQRTLNSALRYQSAHFIAEGGFNFFAQDAECAELCNWCNTVAFVDCRAQQPNDIRGSGTEFLGVPSPYRNITYCNQNCNTTQTTLTEAFYNASVIQQSDLDLSSAAAPAQMLYTFYGTFGYRWDNIEYPVMISLGGSYEFASDNSGLDRWLVWGKIGMSY